MTSSGMAKMPFATAMCASSFPGAPTVIDHGDETITINGDQAQVESTTTIGSEVAPAGDRWEMVRRDNCWYLGRLTYNLEPAH